MADDSQKRILFICMGNICRSPLAEGFFRHACETAGVSDKFHIDSAGTGGWHVGDAPDPRSVKSAARYGVDISAQNSRKLVGADFESFDLLLVMDQHNIDTVNAILPKQHGDKLHMMMDFCLGRDEEIPDPYYGGKDGFKNVCEMVDTASQALLKKLTNGE